MATTKQDLEGYWKENITWVVILLAIWFLVSYVAGILLANVLENLLYRRLSPGLLVRQPGVNGDLRDPHLRLCANHEQHRQKIRCS